MKQLKAMTLFAKILNFFQLIFMSIRKTMWRGWKGKIVKGNKVYMFYICQFVCIHVVLQYLSYHGVEEGRESLSGVLPRVDVLHRH